MKNKYVPSFQQYILRWHTSYGRHELPWRQTINPYKILVSELMLQQTQVERVIPKFLAFIQKFPSSAVLAQASLAEVLSMWQGLGYNRRAKFLWQTAQTVEEVYDGIFPNSLSELQKLPGVGPYTASAVSVFAFNNPEVVIETNIRSVYIYHFFPDRHDILDTELLPLISKTVYIHNPREWYAALMDYGTHLKKILPNPSRKSKHHTKQSKFEGSPRQVRGEIIKYLVQENQLTYAQLKKMIQGNFNYFEETLEKLIDEEMIEKRNNSYQLQK